MNLSRPLAQLQAIELIRPLAETDAYMIRHALVQDTAYTSLLKNERRRLHRLIGTTLEELYPEALQDNAALLARHFVEAGDDTKILEYGECAGDVEARLYAKTEAIEHYSMAVAAAFRLRMPREKLVALITKLGRMYELRDEYTNALKTYTRLLAEASERSDPAMELAALLLQATQRVTPTAIFDPRIGQELCDRALELARKLNDGAAEARVLWNLLLLNGFTGHYLDAVKYGEASLALARQLDLKTQIAYTLNDLGNYGYFASGQLAKSHAALTEARGLWRELGNLPMLADNLNNSGILDYIRADYVQAKQFSDQALQVSERIGSLWGTGQARAFRGQQLAEMGEYGQALYELQTAYELVRHTGSGIQLIAGTNLAVAYALLGEIELGYDIIQIADHQIEIPLYRAPAKAALAYLTFLHGDTEKAETILQAAHPGGGSELEFSYLPSILAKGEIGLARGQAQAVAEYTADVAAHLRNFGVAGFVADAELYHGRALMQLGRIEQAAAAFERGAKVATRIGSQRVLWQLWGQWARAEAARGNATRAQELEMSAYTLLHQIANTLSEQHRALFLRTSQKFIA